MSDSPNLGLPFIEAAQAQKHVTHNEAIVRLDVLVQATVSDMAASLPPAAPETGERVVVGASATGAFAGHDGQIAFYDEGAWRFLSPREGWTVWSANDSCVFVFVAGVWVKLADTLRVLQNLEGLGIGATTDAANPLSVRAANALFTARYAADGGDGTLRFKLNKEDTAASVSQLYQTNWSGRAETGLCGDDSWSVRRSNDGVNWTTSLVVDPAQVATPAGSQAAPGLAFLGDTDTGLHRPGDNTLGVVVGGAERVRVESAGVSICGPGVVSKIQSAAAGGILQFERSNGSLSAPTIAPNGGLFGRILARGYDGAKYAAAALIDFHADGTPALDSMPARISFHTTPAGSTSTAERMRIDKDGRVGVGASAPSTTLHVNGPIRCGSYTRTTLPSAASVGAGTMAWVTNPASGAARAFWSTGTDWRDQANVAA